MASPGTIAVLVDGGFVTKILRKRLGRFPDVNEVEATIMDALRRPELAGAVLYRIFYYDADPWKQAAVNPISKASTDFGATEFARKCQQLLHGAGRVPRADATSRDA